MFAPYQADPPEASRSPDTASPRTSLERRPWSPLGGSYSYQKRTSQASPPPLQHPQPQRSWQTPGYQIPSPSYQQSPAPGGGGVAANNKNYHNAVAAAGAANPAPTRPSLGGDGYFGNISSGFAGATDREGINEFDTSLGIRLDYEACLAYLALPPLGAIVLLILERKSDYVRFHAWQSALLFTVIFIFHIVFSWSTFFGWLFFLCDLALIALLTMRAYRDADMLDRYEVPFFGHIASRFLDDE